MKRIRPVATEDDIVDIPSDFDNLLTSAISRRLAAFRGQSQEALAHEAMFRQRVQELKAWQNRQPGRLRAMRPLSATPSRWPY